MHLSSFDCNCVSAHNSHPAAVNQLAAACDVGNNQLFVLCRCLQLPLMSALPRCCCGLFPRVHVQSQINVTLLIKMDSVFSLQAALRIVRSGFCHIGMKARERIDSFKCYDNRLLRLLNNVLTGVTHG